MQRFLLVFLSFWSFSGLLFLSGCTHEMRHFFTGTLKPKAFANISVGMCKNAVLMRIGKPDIVRGSMRDEQGQVVEVWEYKVAVERRYLAQVQDIVEKVETYCLQFVNGRLVSWGKPGDWERRPDYISEVRYR